MGKVYDGTVLKILEFGAIVQVLPGRDGLLHVSQIANERVNRVEDYVKEGQTVRVKVIEADDKGRLRLSMKAAAMEQNAEAPAAMAQACAALGIPFVHISTDYVFPGTGEAPWGSDSPTAPLQAYGRTKRVGEVTIMESGAFAVVLRTSWVFDGTGKNFLTTMRRLGENREALTVVGDQIGGPTPAAAIAQACLRIVDRLLEGAPGGIYHFSGAPDVSWADFARAIFISTGQGVTVTDIPTSDYPTPATRPLNSRLDCRALENDFGITGPDWRQAIHEIVKETP